MACIQVSRAYRLVVLNSKMGWFSLVQIKKSFWLLMLEGRVAFFRKRPHIEKCFEKTQSWGSARPFRCYYSFRIIVCSCLLLRIVITSSSPVISKHSLWSFTALCGKLSAVFWTQHSKRYLALLSPFELSVQCTPSAMLSSRSRNSVMRLQRKYQ